MTFLLNDIARISYLVDFDGLFLLKKILGQARLGHTVEIMHIDRIS